MKAIGTEPCAFKGNVVKLFSSVCPSEIYTMKFHSMGHLLADVRRFWEISTPNAPAYK